MTVKLKTERIRRGEIITARMLNNHAKNLDFLKQQIVNPPRERDAPPPPDVQNEDPATGSPNTYTETVRQTSEVQIFDQNEENYALIDRIDQATFQNPDGDTITLVFNNPEP